MKNFRRTSKTIQEAISALVPQMMSKGLSSVVIKTFNGIVRLPGGAYIAGDQIIASLTTDSQLLIKRSDRTKDSGHSYPLDYFSVEWLKENRIQIPNQV